MEKVAAFGPPNLSVLLSKAEEAVTTPRLAKLNIW
jgi:hypothetical protein